jgi:hypothetical protein
MLIIGAPSGDGTVVVTADSALIAAGQSTLAMFMVVMVVVLPPRMPDGVSTVTASADVFQAFEAFVRHGLVMKFEV